MLHQLLAPVPRGDEAPHDVIGVDDIPVGDLDGDDRVRAGTETLEEGADPGDDDARASLGVTQSPEHLEPATHRLDRGGHPLEGKGLPGGEQRDRVGREQLTEIVVESGGVGARRAGDEEGTAFRESREGGERHRPRHLGDREPSRRVPECPHDRGLVAEQADDRPERRLGHRELMSCIVSATPRRTTDSTASAAISIETSRTSRCFAGILDST